MNFQEELIAGEETATCPSCSLIVKVIYDPVSDTEELKTKQYNFLEINQISLFFQEMFKAETEEDTTLNDKLSELKLEKN